jgi:hypothetical protein
MSQTLGPFSLDVAEQAVKDVRLRLLKAAKALAKAKIPYAVIGGNAVALWVSRVDKAAVRNTQDVDILVRRADFSSVKSVLESVGFTYRHVASLDVFLENPSRSPRDAVHILFAGEKVRPDESASNPDVSESEDAGKYRVISLEALVRIKLTAFRDKDRMHLRDLIEVGLLGTDWLGRLSSPLADRLQQLLDNPLG